MELALGTVQFGMLYGVSARNSLLSDDQIRDILDFASRHGITLLDTAPAYGNIESRLGPLCGNLHFEIVSKIPPLPNHLDETASVRWVLESAERSYERLGNRLRALLFHRAEDLAGSTGEAVAEQLANWGEAKRVLVGASGYDATLVRQLFQSRRISIAQVPGNALDQRVDSVFRPIIDGAELHIRSAFLQGLLLMPLAEATKRVPEAAPALERWHQWIRMRGITPLRGALSIVKSFKAARTCVVGVDSIGDLDEILTAWAQSEPISAPELASDNPKAVDPRFW